MTRLLAAAIAALLGLASCAAPAPAPHDQGPFYLSSPNLDASPPGNDSSSDSPARHSHGGIGNYGAPGANGGMQDGMPPTGGMPDSTSPTGGSMSVGGGGG